MAIKFEQVSYSYRSMDGSMFSALKDVSFELDTKGEFVTLVGETGSGKSTLVQHMNALIQPQKGEVTIYGVKIDKQTKKSKKVKLNPLRQKVGLVFQFPEYQLFEETVEKDIMFGPKNFGVSEEEARQRAQKVIKLVGLDESYLLRSPFNLSGGEKKRVSIAGILAMEPDILVLDEPTSGLDPKGRDDLLKLFKEIHKEVQNSVVIITHDMNTVYKYAKRVMVMNRGELVFDGSPETLFLEGDLEKWNLDIPEIIDIKNKLEEKLSVKIAGNPKNIEELFQAVKGVL